MTWKADPLSDPNSLQGPNAAIPCCERDTDGDGTCPSHDTRLKEEELFCLQLAINHHGGQTHGDRPFASHLLDVGQEVVRWRLEWHFPGILCASFLHDSVEDTSLTYEQLELLVAQGKIRSETLAMVWAVTDPPEGANRKERKALVYVKIRELPAAVALKLCDRIANVKQCLRDGNIGFLSMYREEQPGFREALYQPGEFESMWAELERLLASEVSEESPKRVVPHNPLVFHVADNGDALQPDGKVHVLYEVDADDPTEFVEQLTAISHAVCGVSLGVGTGPMRLQVLSVEVTCPDCRGFIEAL